MKTVLVVLLLLAGAMLVPLGGAPPSTYTVVRGDTLGKIAQREGVSVDELRAWNGIAGDLIEVDQRLKLGSGGPGVPVWRRVRERLEALRPAPQEPEAVAEADEPSSDRERARSARSRRTDEPPPPSDVDAEAPAWPPLQAPPAKRCLDETAGTDGGSFGRSQGLDSEQIKGAVAAFQRETLRCYEGHPDVAGEVLLDLVVGCDGRVLRSSVDRHDTGSSDFALCVAEVFRYASFPAHARDEVEFAVPLRFVGGG